MIDISDLRVDKGGDPEKVRQSEIRRGRSGSIVDKVIEADSKWIKAQWQVDCAKRDANAAAKEVGMLKKKKATDEECAKAVDVASELKKSISVLEKVAEELVIQRDRLLAQIGNYVHDSVPISRDESDNSVLRTWGEIPKQATGLAHYEIMSALDGFEMKKANEVAGHRGYYLKGYCAMLNQAILQYGQKFMRQKGYVNIQPPYFMKRSYMTKAAELADFNETLYKIPADASESSEDLFMVATAEQPLCCLHADEYVDPKSLPIKYVGVSPCFRKEAGSHGKDMRGIFRVHQFEKVEQFILCDPKDSWSVQESMIAASEEFYRSLDLPYRVVAIVSGALNDAAARKYDLEAWFPSYNDYRELVSCSNCTDYQARNLNIRYGVPKMGAREKAFVHMLNGTLTASQRTLCCLLERWQRSNGVEVPPPLRPYMDDLTFLPYVENALLNTSP